MLCEICGSSTDDAIDGRQLTSHHVSGQFSRDANREIVSYLSEFEVAVADGEIDLYFRVLPKKNGQGRCDMQRRKCYWSGALEDAARLGMQTLDKQFGLFRFLHDTGTVLVERCAEFGKTELASRAIQ